MIRGSRKTKTVEYRFIPARLSSVFLIAVGLIEVPAVKPIERVSVLKVARRPGEPDRVVAFIEHGAWDDARADICYFPELDKMPVEKLDGLIAEEKEMRAWSDARPGGFNLRAFLIHKMGR